MSLWRLVTRATFTPGPELELVAGDGGADGHADEAGLHAVGGQGELEVAARAPRWPGGRPPGWPVRSSRLAGGSFHVPSAAPGRGRSRAAPPARRRRAAASGREPGPALGVGRLEGDVVERRRRQRLPGAGSPSARRRRRLVAVRVGPSRSLASVDTSSNLRRAAPNAGRPDGGHAAAGAASAVGGAARTACAATSGWPGRCRRCPPATSSTVAPAAASRPRTGSPRRRRSSRRRPARRRRSRRPRAGPAARGAGRGWRRR